MKQHVFFDFLQIAIGAKDSWDWALTDEDWRRLYDFCKRQALLGVGFTAVERLHGMGHSCPPQLRMAWLGVVMQIERRNELLSAQCKELTAQFAHDGFQTCILKGQGNLLAYPEELRKRRQPGDIDVWTRQTKIEELEYGKMEEGRRAVREYVRLQHRIAGNFDKVPVRYHHIDAPDMDGTPVEVHFRVGHFASPLRNWRMQRWFDAHAEECMKNLQSTGFAVPTASVNVVYQMTHLFTHYMDEGLGLRQLLDYYYTLRLWHNDCQEANDLREAGLWTEGVGVTVMEKDEIGRTLRWMGMGRFAAAVMWVLHEVFALPTHYYIYRPNEREGRRLLREIMLAGNFGQYDERGRELKTGGTAKHALWKLKRVMRLVGSYPEEALSEPLFRLWHWAWRKRHQ